MIRVFMSFGVLLLLVATGQAQTPLKKNDLTIADREAWRKVLQWPVDLEQQWQRSRIDKNSEASGLNFYKLGQGNYLVAIEVHESAYQPRYVFMYYSESERRSLASGRLLKLKTYERDDDDGHVSMKLLTEVEGVATFDNAKKQLVFYTKGRGIGDCGSLVRYNIFPNRTVPAEARVHACYDDYSLGVTDPLRWKRVKRL
ncbi:MAG TPA: DUF1176 domain-containing protein [Pyrinomonadaceae bacterium]|jgi:hypothetical protein